MSGGAYNYLWCKDASDVAELYHVVEEIQDRLTALQEPCAAKANQQVLTTLKAFEDAVARMQEVWRALEYFDSNDTSREQFNAKLQEWKRKYCTVEGQIQP